MEKIKKWTREIIALVVIFLVVAVILFAFQLATATSAHAAGTTLPKAPIFAQYGLRINHMSDRPDGYWRDKYETAKAKRTENLKRADINDIDLMPYYEVFTLAPHGDMIAERKSRPVDGKFLVRLLKKAPVLDIQPGDSATVRAKKYSEYLRQFQYPPEDNVLTGEWVYTGERGYKIAPITVSLDQFEVALVQPEHIGDVLEPVIVVYRRDFERLSNPVNIWEVSSSK